MGFCVLHLEDMDICFRETYITVRGRGDLAFCRGDGLSASLGDTAYALFVWVSVFRIIFKCYVRLNSRCLCGLVGLYWIGSWLLGLFLFVW